VPEDQRFLDGFGLGVASKDRILIVHEIGSLLRLGKGRLGDGAAGDAESGIRYWRAKSRRPGQNSRVHRGGERIDGADTMGGAREIVRGHPPGPL
jgi:hypothetical protein